MRLVVTGAGGMLGSDVMRAAPDAVGFAREDLDVTDAQACRRALRGADAVINCAAWTDVDGAESQEEVAAGVNGEGAGNVARAAAETGGVVVHVSTDYVFDGRASSGYSVSSPAAPLSAYGRTKLAGERAMLAAPRTHVARTSWLFGVGGANFVETMLRLGAERDAVTVVDDQVGAPTATAHLAPALLELLGSGSFGLHHLPAGGSCSWWEFAREIFARAGVDCEVRRGRTAELARPAPRPACSILHPAPGDPRLPHWREGLGEYLAARVVA